MERREVAHEEFVPGHRIVFFKQRQRIETNDLNEKDGNASGVIVDEHESQYGDGYDDAKLEKSDEGSDIIPVRQGKNKEEEEWDGRLTEDIEWEEWTKRGLNPSVNISGNGKIPGKIVWDRRERIDLIFSSQ